MEKEHTLVIKYRSCFDEMNYDSLVGIIVGLGYLGNEGRYLSINLDCEGDEPFIVGFAGDEGDHILEITRDGEKLDKKDFGKLFSVDENMNKDQLSKYINMLQGRFSV